MVVPHTYHPYGAHSRLTTWARAETETPLPNPKIITPHPYTLNANGTGRAILRQDMAFFDTQAEQSSGLTAALSHDAALVEGAVGGTMGLLVQVILS